MKRSLPVLMLAFAVTLQVGMASANNLLVNPGFEDPVTYDGPPFVGFWEAFSAGAGSGAGNTNTLPLSGAQHLEMVINGVASSFAGVFQQVAINPSLDVTFSGFGASLLESGGSEVRFEWFDATETALGGTPNLVPVLGTTYTPFSYTATPPAGAVFARAVYAIQSFGGPVNQQVYLDDLSVTQVPEPATALLALVALAPLGLRRR
ncbi:hypothetical protein [Botrimarina hoheduenensis]|uniref:PEP-CTERM protein-sorting domain-containing protein n=1 Tax=Botrimarina hoheduenensis TaxID=2528000 RepID=A0A5C5WBY4_9BACT|nr:hypothetical protein [Botrimarina hoheduenensis]TWT47615.1 hypothetical protein Pla111_12300 [Botrimarina hoheduenensis]